jgi:hypothetical protein
MADTAGVLLSLLLLKSTVVPDCGIEYGAMYGCCCPLNWPGDGTTFDRYSSEKGFVC